MKDKKDARDSFIKLANKKFTEKDIFIKISYKEINKREPLLTRLRLGNKIFIGYLRKVGKNR